MKNLYFLFIVFFLLFPNIVFSYDLEVEAIKISRKEAMQSCDKYWGGKCSKFKVLSIVYGKLFTDSDTKYYDVAILYTSLHAKQKEFSGEMVLKEKFSDHVVYMKDDFINLFSYFPMWNFYKLEKKDLSSELKQRRKSGLKRDLCELASKMGWHKMIFDKYDITILGAQYGRCL